MYIHMYTYICQCNTYCLFIIFSALLGTFLGAKYIINCKCKHFSLGTVYASNFTVLGLFCMNFFLCNKLPGGKLKYNIPIMMPSFLPSLFIYLFICLSIYLSVSS